MLDGYFSLFVRRVGLVLGGSEPDAAIDARLLQAFVTSRDEPAFAALVQRHGRLVLSVCRRVLSHQQDAEDAFQATFLLLARKANGIRQPSALRSWLYCVAFRVAKEARAQAVRRQSHERRAAEMSVSAYAGESEKIDPPAGVGGPVHQELRHALLEEVARLPEKLRAAVILCHFEGQSDQQAARALGCPRGTVGSRLARARDQLRRRLARRGLTLTGGAVVTLLTEQLAGAVPPAGWTAATIQAGLANLGRQKAAVSPGAAILVAHVLRATRVARLKAALAVLMVAGLTGIVAVLAYHVEEHRAADARPTALEPPNGELLPPHALARLGEPRPIFPGLLAALAMAPDGRSLATAGQDGTVHLWDVGRQREVRVCAQHPGGLGAVAFAPDGRTLATGGNDHTVRLWDVATGRERAVFAGHQGPIQALAFAPDGSFLASGGADKSVRLWEMATGRERFAGVGHTGTISALAFTLDGRQLASGGEDRNVRLWDVATGRATQTWTGYAGEVRALAFAPDGKRLAVAGRNFGVRLRNLATVEEREFSVEPRGGIIQIATLSFTPDGQTLAAWGVDCRVRLWETATGRLRQFPAGIPLLTGTSGVFAPDGRTFAFATGHGFDLWDVTTGEPKLAPGTQHWKASLLIFAPDGRTLASSDGSIIHLWDAAGWRERHALTGHLRSITALAFAPDGRTLASAAGGGDGPVRLWDVTTGMAQWLQPLQGVTCLAFAPDGRSLAWAGRPRPGLGFCDPGTGRSIPIASAFSDVDCGMRSLAFVEGGRTLATVGTDNRIRRWEVATGRETSNQLGRVSAAGPFALSSDGNRLACGYPDGTVALWDVAADRELFSDRAHQGAVTAVALSPDGKQVASGSADGTVCMREGTTGQECQTFAGGQGEIVSLAFSTDGRTLASSGADTTILVWSCAGR